MTTGFAYTVAAVPMDSVTFGGFFCTNVLKNQAAE